MPEERIYEPTEEETRRAGDLLMEVFGDKLGFPATATALRMTARGLARIVWFLPRSEIMKILRPNEPEHWVPHHIAGDRPDHEWLMEEAVEICGDRMPPLIELRRLHDRWVPNRDGRESEEMGIR